MRQVSESVGVEQAVDELLGGEGEEREVEEEVEEVEGEVEVAVEEEGKEEE